MALSLPWLIGVSLLCWYLFSKAKEQRRLGSAKLPPGPTGLPIVGSALDIAKNPHLIPLFNKWQKQYGNIAGFHVFGQNMVVISDETIANDLFSKRGNIYSDRGTPPALQVFADGVSPALIDKTGN